MATAFKSLFQRRGGEQNRAGGSELSDGSETAPAWLKGGVFKPNRQVGKTLPIAWDGTAGAEYSPSGAEGQGRGGGSPIVPANENVGNKLRSTLDLPEGQVQILVDPEAARIWGAIREVSEALIEKALLCGEAELVAKFRQELAVLQIRNPGLLHSDALCSLLNELAHVDLLGLSRQRAVLALQKVLLTMQELSQRSEYQYVPEGVDPAGVRGLPPSSLPDLTIYIQDYKTLAQEAQAKARNALKRAEEAEQALATSKLAPSQSPRASGQPTQKTLTPAQQKTHRKAIDAVDDNIRRAELQLSDLEQELADKNRRYNELMAKIAATKESIEEIDSLLKTRTKENDAKLRQVLQKQNAAALQLGLESATAAGTGGTTARGMPSSRGTAMQGHVNGRPTTQNGENIRPSKMLGKMLPPDDPTLVAYLAENRRVMEDAAAKAIVEFVTNLLGLGGLVDEIENSDEWKAAMGDGASARGLQNGEEGEDDEEDEEDCEEEEDEEEDGSMDYDDDALDAEMDSVLDALDELDAEDDGDDEDEDAAEAEAAKADSYTGRTINRVLAGVLGEIEGSPVAVRTRRGASGRRGRNSRRKQQQPPRVATPEDTKTVMDAETRIRKLLTFLQTRMEARGVAVGRLQTLWTKLQVPQDSREAVLARFPSMGSADLAGLQSEVRELEDTLAEARAKERVAQGNALRNAVMMVDTLEPKWTEMEAERVKLKALKAIPGSSKDAERMLISEAKTVAKAEQRAIKKRKELFERFDSATMWFPNMKPDLLSKFKEDHMSLAPTNLAELEVMIEFVELKARVPRATKDFKEKKRQLKMLVRDKGMAKGMRRAALKEKRTEIKELKSLRAELKRDIKTAGQSMPGIVMLTYLKKKKKKITAKAAKKLEAAADKQRRLNLAKETMKRDVKPSSMQLEKTIWRRKMVEAPIEEPLSPVTEERGFSPEVEGDDVEEAAIEVLQDIDTTSGRSI